MTATTVNLDMELQERMLELLALAEGIPGTVDFDAQPEPDEWERVTHLLRLAARLASETRTLYWSQQERNSMARREA